MQEVFDIPTENKTHCMPTFRCIHPLSGVSPLFTCGTPNTHVNGANFILNCHNTLVNTLKSYYSIQTCIHSLFLVGDIKLEIVEFQPYDDGLL